MSISIEEARRKLDILEELANDPSLILTELFSEGVSGSNFLYQVKVNEKYILDYLNEYLSKLPVFSGCKIINNCGVFKITVEPLRVGVYADCIGDDEIVKIYADKRTYRLLIKDINDYEKLMSREHILETVKLSDYWVRFVDLTFKKRILNSFNSLKSNKRFFIRILDFIFWYRISNKKIGAAIEREMEKVNNANAYNIKEYNEDIEEQKYYLQYAPDHIKNIKLKQEEISNYLNSIGYKEMSNY